jgi:aspartate racemase
LLELCRGAIERRGADGVILGCTELPLAISQDDLEAPVIDTVRVHVQAILDRALETCRA